MFPVISESDAHCGSACPFSASPIVGARKTVRPKIRSDEFVQASLFISSAIIY